MSHPPSLLIRQLGTQAYVPVWRAMQAFTQTRDDNSQDELWLVQHPPVYTLGLNGKRRHLLQENTIPVVEVDRGGQVTYHGPGQLVAYTLIDLGRKHLGVRDFVHAIEQALIELLAERQIVAQRRPNAPGVYVDEAKIAALGLRIKKDRSYHGLALNIDMDLSPFAAINPCGYAGMPVTQLADLRPHDTDFETISAALVKHLCQQLHYPDVLASDLLPASLQNTHAQDGAK
ncbi:MAG: lipoyl(octanoyl) transferase LipB [Gammaproteobacteria bacterium]